MKLKSLAIAAVAALSLPAFAAVSPGLASPPGAINASYAGEGELFLVIADSTAKVSYTFDLGVKQTDFFNVAQAEAGYTRTWSVGDANLTSFLGLVSAANLEWAVHALDQTGGIQPGGVRLFATVKNGDESRFGEFDNGRFSQGASAAQAGTFFNALNQSGTHGVSGVAPVYADNGSSVNRDSDAGNGYYGSNGGLTSNLNGRAPFFFTNGVGQSSAFYQFARSSTDPLGFVTADPFNNTANNGSFLLAQAGSGYELTYTLAPVPEPGTFAMLLAGFLTVGAMARRRGAF